MALIGFYSVRRHTILLVNGELLGVKGLKLKRFLLALSAKTLIVTVKEITK